MAGKNTGNKDSIVAFGKGWFIIIYCMAMFWFYVGFVNDGANILAPAVAANLGIESGVVLNCNSIAGIVGVLLFIVIGQANRKLGARIVSGSCMVIAGIAYSIVGNAPNLIVYTVFMIVVVGCIMSAGYIAGGALVAQWFPKKKGIVMGYTTMGHNLGSALYVPAITALVAVMGVKGVIPLSICAIILGIIGFLFVRNTPQERGLNPDNVSDEVYRAEYDVDDAEDSDGGWTTKKLMKTPELWKAAITTGMLQICSVGVMSQLVVRNMELGMSQIRAVTVMSVIAFIGVFGSFLIGYLDERLGTKKTMFGFCFLYAAALICNATNTVVGQWISIILIGMSIGGSANFTTSLPTAIFGRHGFSKVNSVLFPIQGMITAIAFAINGCILLVTGSLRMAYIVLACIAIVDAIIIKTVDEFKFNRDHQAEKVTDK